MQINTVLWKARKASEKSILGTVANGCLHIDTDKRNRRLSSVSFSNTKYWKKKKRPKKNEHVSMWIVMLQTESSKSITNQSFIFYNRLHSKTRWKKVTKLIGTIAFPFLMCDKEKLKGPHHSFFCTIYFGNLTNSWSSVYYVTYK